MSDGQAVRRAVLLVAVLLVGGRLRSTPLHFDPLFGLDTVELYAFIGETQETERTISPNHIAGLLAPPPLYAERSCATHLAGV